MLPAVVKSLFIYIVPLNYFFGEYNVGLHYLIKEQWAADFNTGYIYQYEGSPADQLYNDVFNFDKINYQGPFLRAGIVSLYHSGINPLRTDYYEFELLYRYLFYHNVDFADESEPGKVFNMSETTNAVGLSWIAGYILINGEHFQLDAFGGFGLQFQFREITINSYGYDFQSDQILLNDRHHATRYLPMLNAGLRIGFKKNL
ncbi:MAG: hypothetical protein H7X71_00490 [Chitinophagales bacterium]|nr:hypothetical protein [Chitinophagales bacterium]